MSIEIVRGLEPEPLPLSMVKPSRAKWGKGWRRLGWGVVALSVASFCVAAASTGWDVVRSRRQAGCKEKLGRIGKAFHRYQEAHDRFPAPAIIDGSGKPLLSWRVAILPYLEGGETLYREFHRDEPWDSPHNLALIPRMPAVFGCPSDPGRTAGMTPYRVIASKPGREFGNPMFEDGRGVEMLEVTDGSNGTILVVESPESVPWTRPESLRFEPGEPSPTFGSRHREGFHLLMVDASVHFVKVTFDGVRLMGLITRDGGEVISDA